MPEMDQLARVLANVGPHLRPADPQPRPTQPQLTIPEISGLNPQYDGRAELENVLDSADLAFQSLQPQQIPVFLNIIEIKLLGRDYSACARIWFSDLERLPTGT